MNWAGSAPYLASLLPVLIALRAPVLQENCQGLGGFWWCSASSSLSSALLPPAVNLTVVINGSTCPAPDAAVVCLATSSEAAPGDASVSWVSWWSWLLWAEALQLVLATGAWYLRCGLASSATPVKALVANDASVDSGPAYNSKVQKRSDIAERAHRACRPGAGGSISLPLSLTPFGPGAGPEDNQRVHVGGA
jgi:hypothetical protein